MRTLLMHDVTPEQPVVEVLEAAGHEIVRCSAPGEAAYPCIGLDGTCPLDGTVDVAVVVHDRPTTDIATGEVGAICAARDGVPIVLAGNHTYTPLVLHCDAIADTIEDIPAACDRAVLRSAQHAAHRIGSFAGVDAVVTRRWNTVKVVLAAEATDRQAVLAHQEATRLFPGARTIDVARAAE